jgi:4-amino-4-deoxy-L-arabinose transferase-like glycosyltransferase
MKSLFLITILGLSLRVILLQSFPAGFTPDEASFGYNAYSLLNTGMDEWSVPWYKLFLVNLKSFGDDKLPLYSFFSIPVIGALGLSEFSTRLPNAILAALSIPVVYLLARVLFSKKAATFASAFIAFSPWHISLSRGAFEANIVVFGLSLLLISLLKRKYLFVCIACLLNIYTYHSSRLLTPLIVLIFIIISNSKDRIRHIFLVLTLLIIIVMTSSSRAADVSILNPTDAWASVSDRRYEAVLIGLPDHLSRVFSNKLISTVSTFTKNYLSYFDLTYLFSRGAGEWTYGIISGTSLLLLAEFPLLFYFFFLFARSPSKRLLLVIGLLLVFPLPAVLAKGPGFAANRSIPMLIPLTLMSAYAASLLSTKHRFFNILLFSCIGINLIFWGEDYFFHAQNRFSRAGFYGWDKVVNFVSPLQNNFSIIRVSRSLSEPHAAWAFYSRYPPKLYQSFSSSWPNPRSENKSFLDQHDGYYLSNFRFGNLSFGPTDTPTLFIGKPEDFPEILPQNALEFTSNFPDNLPAIKVVALYPN